MSKRLTPSALAHTDELLAKMRGVASVTSDHLEAWWGTKPRVQRVELFRLLNDLADDGRIAKLPGRRWCLPANVLPQPKAPAPVKAPPMAPVVARKAPPTKPATPPKAPVRAAVAPPAPTSAAGRILAALRKKPDDGPGLVRRLRMNPNTVRGRLSELSRAGWIEMDAACLWEVT